MPYPAGLWRAQRNIWGGAVPYLRPVESGGCLLTPEYETKADFTDAEMAAGTAWGCPSAALTVWQGRGADFKDILLHYYSGAELRLLELEQDKKSLGV